jgi:uncharacterized protein GlcG (DUF336 family)
MRRNLYIGMALLLAIPASLRAQGAADCALLPSHSDLQTALNAVAPVSGAADNGGLDLNMWGSIVNRDGQVCAVAFTGNDRGDQWPGSRVISAQKANTANAFSLTGLALSTANFYSVAQPGGSLFGLQESNPVDTSVAYGGNSQNYGLPNDPMAGGKIGGVNVFGGGLALYNDDMELIGAIGVSGDTSCTDHVVAWKVRDLLGLDFVPAGVAPGGTNGTDNIIFDIVDDAGANPESPSGWGHPTCGNNPDPAALLTACPVGDGETQDCAAADVTP